LPNAPRFQQQMHDNDLSSRLPFAPFFGCILDRFSRPPTALNWESHPCLRRRPRVGQADLDIGGSTGQTEVLQVGELREVDLGVDSADRQRRVGEDVARLVELFKHPAQVFWRNAYPGIGHADYQPLTVGGQSVPLGGAIG